MSQPLTNRPSIRELAEYSVPNTNGEPIIVKGVGAEVVDEEGKAYVDLEGGPGVASVGHCHPHVVAAIREQAGQLLQSPGRFHSRMSLSLSKRIAELTNERLRKVFFANSGAEANDGAVKLAMKHATATGKKGFGIVALEHSFHGRLSLPLSLTGNAARKKGFGPYASFPGVVHVPAPYCYRCPLKLSPDTCGTKCARDLEDALKTRVPGEAAILIAEPILGVGGVIVPPDDYWPIVRDICERNKITLIHDEVFTGFGRTGKTFGHQHWDVSPDVMTFAKALGGGVPLGGFIATAEVGNAFEDGDHFTTFGTNNQIGIAAGHAVLDILAAEQLADRAAAVGERLMEGMRRVQEGHDVIGDLRGKGLMIGVEIVSDRHTKTPAPDLAKKLQVDLRRRGVILGTTGVHGCVLRMTPPLVIKEEQVDQCLLRFEEALRACGV